VPRVEIANVAQNGNNGSPFVPVTKSANVAQRIDQLLEYRRRGICLTRTQSAALELVQKHSVSLRTAFRHVARGTVPATDRCQGGDGKTYPKHRPRASKLQAELKRAANYLRRADKEARACKCSPEEIKLLAGIVQTSGAMLQRWSGEP
jgi:hypothetical protein